MKAEITLKDGTTYFLSEGTMSFEELREEYMQDPNVLVLVGSETKEDVVVHHYACLRDIVQVKTVTELPKPIEIAEGEKVDAEAG